ncbi:MAG: OsmC family protein [Rhodospirillales bacterium]
MAIRQKTNVKLTVRANCPTHARAELQVRDVAFTIDEPVERGGTNTGPSPTENAIASLVGCTNVISHKCAAALGVDLGHLTITAVYELDRRGVTLQEEIEIPFKRVELTMLYDGSASEEDVSRVAADTAKYCALAKLFRNAGTDVVEVWQRAS